MDILFIDEDRPFGVQDSIDAPDERCLARAVWPDKCEDCAGFQPESYVIEDAGTSI